MVGRVGDIGSITRVIVGAHSLDGRATMAEPTDHDNRRDSILHTLVLQLITVITDPQTSSSCLGAGGGGYEATGGGGGVTKVSPMAECLLCVRICLNI